MNANEEHELTVKQCPEPGCNKIGVERKVNEITVRELYDRITGQIVMPFI